MSIGFRPVNAYSGHLRSWRPNRAPSASAAAVALLQRAIHPAICRYEKGSGFAL